MEDVLLAKLIDIATVTEEENKLVNPHTGGGGSSSSSSSSTREEGKLRVGDPASPHGLLIDRLRHYAVEWSGTPLVQLAETISKLPRSLIFIDFQLQWRLYRERVYAANQPSIQATRGLNDGAWERFISSCTFQTAFQGPYWERMPRHFMLSIPLLVDDRLMPLGRAPNAVDLDAKAVAYAEHALVLMATVTNRKRRREAKDEAVYGKDADDDEDPFAEDDEEAKIRSSSLAPSTLSDAKAGVEKWASDLRRNTDGVLIVHHVWLHVLRRLTKTSAAYQHVYLAALHPFPPEDPDKELKWLDDFHSFVLSKESSRDGSKAMSVSLLIAQETERPYKRMTDALRADLKEIKEIKREEDAAPRENHTAQVMGEILGEIKLQEDAAAETEKEQVDTLAALMARWFSAYVFWRSLVNARETLNTYTVSISHTFSTSETIQAHLVSLTAQHKEVVDHLTTVTATLKAKMEASAPDIQDLWIALYHPVAARVARSEIQERCVALYKEATMRGVNISTTTLEAMLAMLELMQAARVTPYTEKATTILLIQHTQALYRKTTVPHEFTGFVKDENALLANLLQAVTDHTDAVQEWVVKRKKVATVFRFPVPMPTDEWALWVVSRTNVIRIREASDLDIIAETLQVLGMGLSQEDKGIIVSMMQTFDSTYTDIRALKPPITMRKLLGAISRLYCLYRIHTLLPLYRRRRHS